MKSTNFSALKYRARMNGYRTDEHTYLGVKVDTLFSICGDVIDMVGDSNDTLGTLNALARSSDAKTRIRASIANICIEAYCAMLDSPVLDDEGLEQDEHRFLLRAFDFLCGIIHFAEHEETGWEPLPKESQPTGTPYAQLVTAEKTCHTIEIREKATGKEGVANTCADGVELFYGADDGSDDKRVTPEAFNRDFEITACLRG